MADDIRNKYVKNVLREQTLKEINGPPITFEGIVNAAVKRARKECWDRGESESLYGTWHQHVGTIGNVVDNFRKILIELNISTSHKNVFMVEWEEKYGTGASLYHE